MTSFGPMALSVLLHTFATNGKSMCTAAQAETGLKDR